MTRDIDIVIALREEDVPRFVDLFQDDFYVDHDMVVEAIRNESMFNIIHNESPVKIDFIVRKNSEYRRLEFDRRRKVPIGFIDLWLVSPEDLILSKLWWARDSHSEQPLSDIRNIMRYVKELDRQYINEWVWKLGLAEIYGELENE